MRKGTLTGAVLLATGLAGGAQELRAAEGGVGFYLLGTRSAQAGILPPPGTYLQNDAYFYSGSASAGQDLPLGGRAVADIDATAFIDLITALWVLPETVLGGNLAVLGTLPVGAQDIDAALALQGGGPGAAVSDSVFTVGDPVLGASLGWHAGKLHWTTGVLVNVPLGDYTSGDIANVAFHRWGLDVAGALTWFDPQSGWDLSASAGMTFNGENPDTDYRTGTELHLEGAVTNQITPAFSAGLAGYYYEQVSGDSGAGATLGSFKGRVAALGVTAAYNFAVGSTPVAARLRVYREFATRNRLDGVAGFLTLTIPIGLSAP
ncbi:SphA family protein [Paroceanicella profunda]|uniref:SphA family protein n=1 Tax=Paroceanicella profunda TaxID=2579971 RepID=UPI001EF0C3EF|nr:transporter [Paroceanicella profunda]